MHPMCVEGWSGGVGSSGTHARKHTAFRDRVESKALRIISSYLLIGSYLPIEFLRHVAYIHIFYQYFHADCPLEVPDPSYGPTAQNFLLKLISILFTFLMQELIRTFIILSSSLVISERTSIVGIFTCQRLTI